MEFDEYHWLKEINILVLDFFLNATAADLLRVYRSIEKLRGRGNSVTLDRCLKKPL
jgi:hypothetical protein